MGTAAGTPTRGPRRSGWRRAPWLPMLVAAVIGWAIGLAFNHVAERRLGDAAVNDLRTLLAGLTAVGFLSIGLQLTLVGWLGRFGTARRLPSGRLAHTVVVAAVVIGLAAGAVAALLIDAGSAFRIEVGVQVAICVAAGIISVPPRAELLHGELWTRLGLLLVLGPAVRLALGAALLSTDRSTSNLIPITLSEIASSAAAFAVRPRHGAVTTASPDRAFVAKGIAASTGLLAVLTLSSLAFRSQLGADADVFNASALVARAVVFAPLAIAYIYFPTVARSPIGSPNLRRAYFTAMAWTGTVAVIGLLVVLLAPERVAHILTSSDQEISATIVRVLGVAWALMALSIVSLLQHIAHGSRLSWTPWVGAVVMLAGQLVAGSGRALALCALIAAVTMLVLVCLPAVLRVQPVLHATTVHPTRSPASSPRGDVTLVVPCYNPGPVVLDTIRDADALLTSLGMAFTIVAVSDGSTDGSDDLIDGLRLPSLVHVRHPQNMGKGAALRTGFARTHTSFVAFIDADGDLSPALLESLLRAQRETQADIVFGSKVHPESVVRASVLRLVYSAAYQALIRVLFQLDIKDTQTGIKLYRHEVVDAILPHLRENAFALDLEMFIAARAAGFTRFAEVPVELKRESGSTISVRAVRQMFTDTMRLFWRAKVILMYFRSAAVPSVAQPATVATTDVAISPGT